MNDFLRAQDLLHTRAHCLGDGSVCIRLSGELDMFSAPELRRSVRRARAAGATSIQLDLHELTFVDVRGARELQATFCALTRVRPEVQRILDLTFAPSVSV